MNIKQLESLYQELAFPQLIPQDKLNIEYVNKWRNDAEKALRIGRHVSIHDIKNRDFKVYHWRKSSVSGVWFVAIDGKTVDFLYAYQSLRLNEVHRASEALAYSFNPEQVAGVIGKVFFDHLLPNLKFVVTDSLYTPDGHRWFLAEYNEAFGRGYKVYAIDLAKNTIVRIDKKKWSDLQPLYWGKDEAHQKYRFAIELP